MSTTLIVCSGLNRIQTEHHHCLSGPCVDVDRAPPPFAMALSGSRLTTNIIHPRVINSGSRTTYKGSPPYNAEFRKYVLSLNQHCLVERLEIEEKYLNQSRECGTHMGPTVFPFYFSPPRPHSIAPLVPCQTKHSCYFTQFPWTTYKLTCQC